MKKARHDDVNNATAEQNSEVRENAAYDRLIDLVFLRLANTGLQDLLFVVVEP